ncbi:unnamed protein product [Urochloa humidicola]
MNFPRMSSPSSSPAPPPAANAAHRFSPLRLYPKHSKPRHYRLAAAVAASTGRTGRRSQSWTTPGRRGGAGSIWVNPSSPPRPGSATRTLRRLVELEDLDAALRLLLSGPSTTTSTPAASDSVPELPAVITCKLQHPHQEALRPPPPRRRGARARGAQGLRCRRRHLPQHPRRGLLP